MTLTEPTVRALPRTRVAASDFWVPGPEEVHPRIGAAFDHVWDALRAAGLQPGLPIAWYAMGAEGIDCWAGFECTGDPAGVEVVELPAEPQALVVRVHGHPSGIASAWQVVYDWLEANGAVASAPGREVYLSSDRDDEASWVTEVEQPFVRR
jgi:effector-binding domain-containing protein